jgi:AraC family transcriptional regulator
MVVFGAYTEGKEVQSMRLEKKEKFTVCGKKTWISGQNNDEFASFWQACNESGLIEMLQKASKDPEKNITHSNILGVSRVEKDPNDRAFWFYVASECESAEGCETFEIPGGEWAIFEGNGNTAMALINTEMEALINWLPNSGYEHNMRPELEVYPFGTGTYVEFRLPVRRK